MKVGSKNKIKALIDEALDIIDLNHPGSEASEDKQLAYDNLLEALEYAKDAAGNPDL